MKTGTIKFFSDRGFGFIIDDDDETKEYFFHHSKVEDGTEPREGMRVQFETRDTERGLQGIKISEIFND